MELDRLDRRLLKEVQRDCAQSAEALGEACGASPSTVLRRLKRLREAGVITAEVAILDAKKVGRPLGVILGVRLEGEDAAAAAAFVRRMRESPLVTQCYFVTGGSDYSLHLSCADMEEYDAFVQAHLVADPHVSTTETHVVISPLKVGLAVPVGE